MNKEYAIVFKKMYGLRNVPTEKIEKLTATWERQGKHTYLDTIINPAGKKATVAIVQTDLPGFTARYAKKPYRLITHMKSAEKLAAIMALKGHKKVEFWD